MSEGNPERITPGYLYDMVHGDEQDPIEASVALSKELYEQARRAYAQALDRGDQRAIEDTEGRLNELYAAHPELRQADK